MYLAVSTELHQHLAFRRDFNGWAVSPKGTTVHKIDVRTDGFKTRSASENPRSDAPGDAIMRPSGHLIRVPEAARIAGVPRSLLRKSFMREEKRPKNIPPPPPHKRIGRAVYIVARELPAWVERLGSASLTNQTEENRRRGRPTVAERIARRKG